VAPDTVASFARLSNTPNTVKTHTRAIYRKLGVSTRTEAVERGYETGLLP